MSEIELKGPVQGFWWVIETHPAGVDVSFQMNAERIVKFRNVFDFAIDGSTYSIHQFFCRGERSAVVTVHWVLPLFFRRFRVPNIHI